MPDIKQIAEACASRIMDRMEMCHGSSLLKSDIAHDVELTLRQEFEIPKDVTQVMALPDFPSLDIDAAVKSGKFVAHPGIIIQAGAIHTDLGNGPVTLLPPASAKEPITP